MDYISNINFGARRSELQFFWILKKMQLKNIVSHQA